VTLAIELVSGLYTGEPLSPSIESESIVNMSVYQRPPD
jgi:hypothetical protein